MKKFRSKIILTLLFSLMLCTSVSAYVTYNGGLRSSIIGINTGSYNTSWSTNITQSLTNWTATPTKASLYSSSSSANYIEASSYADTWYGLYTPYTNVLGVPVSFRIQLNATTINSDATNFDNFVQSCLVHELGHGLQLSDNPPVTDSTIMSYTRDRNSMTKPQQYDINVVNYVYGTP